MQTRVLPANETNAQAEALDLLRRGEVIALPTDTVYGIAADSLQADAIEKLFVIKERPALKAIMLLVGAPDDLERVATNVPESARRLGEAFWPGGLTLVVPAKPDLPANLTAETATIGVRLPNAPLVWELVRQLGRPLAATSANLSGGGNPTTAQEVLAQLGGRFPLILDGGATFGALASTVLDCTTDPPRVLRAGALPIQEIENVLGRKLA